jgi:hypothetical protein
MKNLFKSKIKWQHRSNDPASSQGQGQGLPQQTPPSPSPASSPSGGPPALSVSTVSSSSPSAAATPTGAAAAGAGGGGGGTGGEDYMLSEEEFQMQLAMALSASNSECVGDLDGEQIRKAKLISLGRGDRFAAVRDDEQTADALSRRYRVSRHDQGFDSRWIIYAKLCNRVTSEILVCIAIQQ